MGCGGGRAMRSLHREVEAPHVVPLGPGPMSSYTSPSLSLLLYHCHKAAHGEALHNNEKQRRGRTRQTVHFVRMPAGLPNYCTYAPRHASHAPALPPTIAIISFCSWAQASQSTTAHPRSRSWAFVQGESAPLACPRPQISSH